MKDFIEYLVKQIVSKPDVVTVEETQVGDFYVYTISADADDMGTIIGKKGRNINSIRNMARVKAIKDGIHIRVEVAEPEGGRTTTVEITEDTEKSDAELSAEEIVENL